jgi:hypothetical protein
VSKIDFEILRAKFWFNNFFISYFSLQYLEVLFVKSTKYPRLLLFTISVVIVFFLFSGLLYEPLYSVLSFLGYFGTFLAGLLYPYSFTSAAGTAILLVLAKEQNILYAGIIAGFGALISDMLIFYFVKYSFGDEIQRLSKSVSLQAVKEVIPESVRTYLFAGFASVLIASPLPTEIGIMLMTSVKKITTQKIRSNSLHITCCCNLRNPSYRQQNILIFSCFHTMLPIAIFCVLLHIANLFGSY